MWDLGAGNSVWFLHLHMSSMKLCTYIMYGELLLHDTRIAVQKILWDKAVRLSHEGHHGVVKTKYLLQSKVWWQAMDKDVENVCKVNLPWLSIYFKLWPTWSDVSCFASMCSLARLQCRFVRTPTHRRKYFGGGRLLLQQIPGGCYLTSTRSTRL